jgi:hypothetical protein
MPQVHRYVEFQFFSVIYHNWQTFLAEIFSFSFLDARRSSNGSRDFRIPVRDCSAYELDYQHLLVDLQLLRCPRQDPLWIPDWPKQVGQRQGSWNQDSPQKVTDQFQCESCRIPYIYNLMCPVRFAIPPMKKKTFLGRLIDISYRQHTAKAEKMVRTSSHHNRGHFQIKLVFS